MGKDLNIEQETIVLHSICQMIDDMVNYAMLKISDSRTDGSVLFHSFVHAQLFNVLLVDFLSFPHHDRTLKTMPFSLPGVDKNGAPSDRSYLYYLKLISSDPKFGTVPELLHKSLESLAKWFDGDVVLKDAHFSTLNETIDIRVNRLKVLSMTGNISKHNVTRLSVIAHSLLTIFAENGKTVSLNECYAVLPEFQELFHNHAFIYQSSYIVQMMTDLRWGIHEYLLPELERSSVYSWDHASEQRLVEFAVPAPLENSFSKGAYRLLMQLVWKEPIVKRFVTNVSMRELLS